MMQNNCVVEEMKKNVEQFKAIAAKLMVELKNEQLSMGEVHLNIEQNVKLVIVESSSEANKHVASDSINEMAQTLSSTIKDKASAFTQDPSNPWTFNSEEYAIELYFLQN